MSDRKCDTIIRLTELRPLVSNIRLLKKAGYDLTSGMKAAFNLPEKHRHRITINRVEYADGRIDYITLEPHANDWNEKITARKYDRFGEIIKPRRKKVIK